MAGPHMVINFKLKTSARCLPHITESVVAPGAPLLRYGRPTLQTTSLCELAWLVWELGHWPRMEGLETTFVSMKLIPRSPASPTTRDLSLTYTTARPSSR